ncbi:MAG: PH domain-containing protein [bacterium]|nr:PH domain-containing protein [bacterium]
MPPKSQDPQPPMHRPPDHLPPSMMPPINMSHSFGLKGSEDLLEPGEQLVVIVRKHPIGIVGIYIEALVGLLVVFGLFLAIAPDFFNGLSTQAYKILVGIIVFGLAILILFLFIATYVYRQSRLLVTDRSLVQILQKSLFIRKISRLSMSNVEDVSAEERGILSTIFNYGTIVVQTAGALDNFIFPYCPSPTKYADQIIEARQRYARALEEEHETELAHHLHDMGIT